jgi:methionine synthase II (cobalamin-independent)
MIVALRKLIKKRQTQVKQSKMQEFSVVARAAASYARAMKFPKLPPLYTHAIGSLPRPRAVRDLVEQREAKQSSPRGFDERNDDFARFAIRFQEQAGMDAVCDGEWRRFHSLAECVARIGGFERIRPHGPQGVQMMEWVCNGKIQSRKPVFARDAECFAEHSAGLTKLALPRAFLVAMRLRDITISALFYPTPEALLNDLADTLAVEARALADFGVDIIQIDEPALSYCCGEAFIYGAAHDSRIDMSRGFTGRVPAAVAAINRIADTLQAEVHVRCCRSVFKRRGDVKSLYNRSCRIRRNLKWTASISNPPAATEAEAPTLRKFPSHSAPASACSMRGPQNPKPPMKSPALAPGCIRPGDIDCGFAPDGVNCRTMTKRLRNGGIMRLRQSVIRPRGGWADSGP